MRIKKVIVPILAALILAVPFLAVTVKKISAANSLTVFKRVVIDAGHGGADGGAVGVKTGAIEAELNLAIAKFLKAEFENNGYVVIMTRVDENGLYGDESDGFKLRDLKKRVEIINSAKPEAVISVHINKYSLSSRRGAQVFLSRTRKRAKPLQEAFRTRLI